MAKGTPASNASLRALASSCPSLRILDLSKTNVDKIVVGDLQKGCPALEELYLVECNLEFPWKPSTPVSGEGFPRLRILSLAGSIIRGAGIPWDLLLLNASSLEALDCRAISLSYSSPFNALTKSGRSLRILLLNCCSGLAAGEFVPFLEARGGTLEQVDLSWTKVGDEVVDRMAREGGRVLRVAELAGTHVTREGVEALLRRCRELEKVNLVSCRSLPRELKRVFGMAELRRLREEIGMELD